VSVFYLAGFTPSGKDADRLWVLDQIQGKQWVSKPSAIAHRRDFYRVEASGIEPDAVERILGALEGKAATVLREIRSSGP